MGGTCNVWVGHILRLLPKLSFCTFYRNIPWCCRRKVLWPTRIMKVEKQYAWWLWCYSGVIVFMYSMSWIHQTKFKLNFLCDKVRCYGLLVSTLVGGLGAETRLPVDVRMTGMWEKPPTKQISSKIHYMLWNRPVGCAEKYMQKYIRGARKSAVCIYVS